MAGTFRQRFRRIFERVEAIEGQCGRDLEPNWHFFFRAICYIFTSTICTTIRYHLAIRRFFKPSSSEKFNVILLYIRRILSPRPFHPAPYISSFTILTTSLAHPYDVWYPYPPCP